MTLLEDWSAFKDGTDEYPPEHFTSLIKQHSSDKDLQIIFSGLPRADAAVRRIIELRDRTRVGAFDYWLPDLTYRLEQHEALALVREWAGALRQHLAIIGALDLAEEMDGLQVVMASIDDITAAANDVDHLQFGINDELSDHMGQFPKDPLRVYRPLYGALLDLTRSDEVTRFLIDPIWPYDLKFETDFKLYIGGYDYFIRNEDIILAVEKSA